LVVGLAGERRREIDLVVSEGQPVTCSDGLDRLGDDPLGQIHHRLVVAERLIDLQHREFRIVPRADPLVAVHAPQLVHPLDPADQQPLQVQFQRDPHEEPHVQRVVVRQERPRRRAAGDRMQRRTLDLAESGVGQRAADRLHDLGAVQKPLQTPSV
jgi:hypothetical protein